MPTHFGDRFEEAVKSGRLCEEDARDVWVYAHPNACTKSRFKNAGPVGGFKLRRHGFYRVDQHYVYDRDLDRVFPRRRIRRGDTLTPRPTIVTGVNDGTEGKVLTLRSGPLKFRRIRSASLASGATST